jgi:hypothetical protein
MNREYEIQSAINGITEQIIDIISKIEYLENITETDLDVKKVELNIAFLENKLKTHQLTLVGLRSNSLRIQLLVQEKIRQCITERQEIIEEYSERGYNDDNNYNNHCLFHRDLWRILDGE